jgi:hypothetical protein
VGDGNQSPQRTAWLGQDVIVFVAGVFRPFRSHEESKRSVEKPPDKHVVLVHPRSKKTSNSCHNATDTITHRKRSIPFHSRTVISQNPRRNPRDEDVEVIVRMSSASSLASACCTRGLSDIQKPANDKKLKDDEIYWKERRTVENPFPQFCHFALGKCIASVRRIRQKNGKTFYRFVARFLVFKPVRMVCTPERAHDTHQLKRGICSREVLPSGSYFSNTK